VDKKSIKLVFKRDKVCWHCGLDDDTLILHHRKNRGMGGSPSRDTLANVILVCSRYNQQMEDSGLWAARAREHGHKLASWQKPDSVPVFSVPDQEWFLLDDKGGRVNVEEISGIQ
jgi:hypothetical protein